MTIREGQPCLILGLILFFALSVSVQASGTGVPLELLIVPNVIEQGEDSTSPITTQVTLRAPSPCYFICEVRSADSRQLECRDIIFRKGDTIGSGTGTVDWSEVTETTTLRVSAFSVDAPDKAVTIKVTLQRKDDETSP